MSLLIEAAVTIRVLFAIYSHLRREKFRRAHFCTACIKSIRKFTFSPTARLERHRNSTFRTSYILTYYLHKTHAAVALSLVARALRDAEIRCVWISSGVGGAGDSRASTYFYRCWWWRRLGCCARIIEISKSFARRLCKLHGRWWYDIHMHARELSPAISDRHREKLIFCDFNL